MLLCLNGCDAGWLHTRLEKIVFDFGVVPNSSKTIIIPKQSSWYAVQSLVWTDMMQDVCTHAPQKDCVRLCQELDVVLNNHNCNTIWIYIQNWTDMMQGYCTSASKRWYKALSVHSCADYYSKTVHPKIGTLWNDSYSNPYLSCLKLEEKFKEVSTGRVLDYFWSHHKH